ncbi:MAG: serine/threonine-protein kinase [Acidobacteriota bacterium]|jgi:serine/threonine-protein kinase
MIGRQIGSWILERELGRGGMGAVFLARHARLGTPAAVKALSPALGVEPGFRDRFEREAEVHAGLRHPHVARVHDYLEEDDRWFLVIEYLPGGSLADLLADLPASGAAAAPHRAVGWIRQALAGLSHAHEHGVVHRDVKPANLMLDEHGAVKVSDFGIARPAAGTQLTSTGMSLGTLQYMSPEQLDAPDRVDRRADLYSTGVVLYELLAGRVPFDGETPSQIFRAHLTDEPPPPIRELRPDLAATLDPALERIVLRSLERDPERRFQSAGEMRDALAPFEEDRPEAGGTVGTVLWTSTSAAPTAAPPTAAPPPDPHRTRRLTMAAAALVIALGLAAAGALVFTGNEPVAPDGPTAPDPPLGGIVEDGLREGATGVSEERLREGAREASSRAEEATGAAEAARAALERARRAASRAKDALGRVLEARELPVASGAAREARQAARTALREAETVSGHAATARQAAEAAGSAVEELGALRVARAHPLHSVLLLAAVPTTRGGGSSSFAETARQAAEEARRAAEEATKAEKEAELHAEIAERSSEEAASALERLRPMLEGRPGQDAAGLLPPHPGPLPEQPVVAVVATGDPVFAAPLEEVLERRLRRAGFDVQDERGVPELDRLLRDRGADADPEEIGELLVEDGFHVLVLAPVEIGDRKQASLLGVDGSISFGQTRMNAYLLPADRRLGRGWRERVEYSELNAGPKAEQALIGATRDLVGEIREGWSGFRDRVARLERARAAQGTGNRP